MISIIPLLFIGVMVSFSRMRQAPATGVPTTVTFPVARRDLTISVTESGEVRSLESTVIKSEVEGMEIIVSVVPEGTTITEEDVKNGRVLCEMDTSELREDLLRQRILFSNAEAAFIQAQEALEIQTNQNASDMQAAALTVRFALLELQKYLSAEAVREVSGDEAAVTDPEGWVAGLAAALVADPNDARWGGAALQEKRRLEAAIKLAGQQLEKDKNQLQGTEKLYAKEYVAYAELERDRLAFSHSETSLQKAEMALELFLQYDFPKQVATLVSAHAEARREADRTEARVRSLLAQAQGRVNSKKVIYLQQKERRDKLERQIAACTIKAPVAGLVIYGSSDDYDQKNEDPIEVGDGVHKGQKIFTIPDLSKMGARIMVHETWVNRVRPGLPVRVRVDPFPDREFCGEVIKVAPLPNKQSRWRGTGEKLYTTEISFAGGDFRIRPGMSAKVEIIIDELADVLCVPLQAVSDLRGMKVCYVAGPEGLEAREVTMGLFNDSFVEIRAGLQEGERISLVSPSMLEAEQEKATRLSGGEPRRRPRGGPGGPRGS